jgi:hypothetical protein
LKRRRKKEKWVAGEFILEGGGGRSELMYFFFLVPLRTRSSTRLQGGRALNRRLPFSRLIIFVLRGSPATQTALAWFPSSAHEAQGLHNTVNRPVYRLEFLVPETSASVTMRDEERGRLTAWWVGPNGR